jgi:ASC-1-like (ASCH) protein
MISQQRLSTEASCIGSVKTANHLQSLKDWMTIQTGVPERNLLRGLGVHLFEQVKEKWFSPEYLPYICSHKFDVSIVCFDYSLSSQKPELSVCIHGSRSSSQVVFLGRSSTDPSVYYPTRIVSCSRGAISLQSALTYSWYPKSCLPDPTRARSHREKSSPSNIYLLYEWIVEAPSDKRIVQTPKRVVSNTWSMNVQPRWFDLIASGEKKYEGRIHKGDRVKMQEGDFLIFTTTLDRDGSGRQEKMETRIIEKNVYSSFREMLETLGIEHVLPGVETIEEGVKIYHSFPGFEEGAKEFGVVAFKIENISKDTV